MIESLVIGLEIILYDHYFKKMITNGEIIKSFPYKNLIFSVIIANLVSFIIGILVFSLFDYLLYNFIIVF